jgi:hypothetical protein
MEFNYSHLIKEISRYLSKPAIETKISYDVTHIQGIFCFMIIAIMVDGRYMGKRCRYYYMDAVFALIFVVAVVADDDLVQTSIDAYVLGKH